MRVSIQASLKTHSVKNSTSFYRRAACVVFRSLSALAIRCFSCIPQLITLTRSRSQSSTCLHTYNPNGRGNWLFSFARSTSSDSPFALHYAQPTPRFRRSQVRIDGRRTISMYMAITEVNFQDLHSWCVKIIFFGSQEQFVKCQVTSLTRGSGLGRNTAGTDWTPLHTC